MKSVRIHEYGGRETLRYEESPMPQMSNQDVLIKVVAAAVNPVDWKIREGYLKEMISYQFPLILGWDLSGIVDKVGDEVTGFTPGDAVYSRPELSRDGAYAEYIAVRATELARKPETVSFAEAASIPLAGITAWEAVINRGRIAEGQSILIHAAAGGVGSLAVQLAKWKGAHVYATCSERNLALVKSLGADEVVDYEKNRFQDIVRDVDVVFDTIGGQVQEASWSVLKPRGMLVSIVQPPSQERANQVNVRGEFVFIQPSSEILGELSHLVDNGTIRPVVGAEFSLKDVTRAHELSESGRARGKIVVHVGVP
jgi:NADPH:quinone reductase-like Zn-dependent oxidoreductase